MTRIGNRADTSPPSGRLHGSSYLLLHTELPSNLLRLSGVNESFSDIVHCFSRASLSPRGLWPPSRHGAHRGRRPIPWGQAPYCWRETSRCAFHISYVPSSSAGTRAFCNDGRPPSPALRARKVRMCVCGLAGALLHSTQCTMTNSGGFPLCAALAPLAKRHRGEGSRETAPLQVMGYLMPKRGYLLVMSRVAPAPDSRLPQAASA